MSAFTPTSHPVDPVATDNSLLHPALAEPLTGAQTVVQTVASAPSRFVSFLKGLAAVLPFVGA